MLAFGLFRYLYVMNAEFWNKAGRVVKRSVEVAAVLLLVFLLLWFMVGILSGGGKVEAFLKYVTIVLFFVFLAGVAVKLVLSLFVKDKDEERELEELVDLVLQRKLRQQQTVDANREVFSPLVGLDEAQTEAVCRLLQALPPHHADAQRLSLAPTVQLLTALKELSFLEDADHYNLYYWVERITGLSLPSFREFNEAYPSSTRSKVDRAKKQIRDALAKVR